MSEGLKERLASKIHRGQYTIGSGYITADGRCEIKGGEKIMELRNPDGPEAAARITQLEAEVERLESENVRAWTERNTAYAKVKAWEAVVYVERLPLRSVRIDEWGPGEGGMTSVPEITHERLTDLIDELARLRALHPQGE